MKRRYFGWIGIGLLFAGAVGLAQVQEIRRSGAGGGGGGVWGAITGTIDDQLDLIAAFANKLGLTDFDPAYFKTNGSPITLIGTLTNWAKLDTNQVSVDTNSIIAYSTNSAKAYTDSRPSGIPGTVSNAVVSSGLLAVNAYTNARAATFSDATNALGYKPVNLAGDTMTGALATPQLQITNVSASSFAYFDSGKNLTNAPYMPQTGSANLTNWSAIATNLMAPLASPAFTGTPTINGASIETQLTNKVLKAGDTMSGTLGFSGTSTLVNLPSLTTAQKNAATGVAGSLVYDSNLGRVQAYDGAAWHSRVRLDGDTMTGPLSVPFLFTGDGTSSAPTISFSSKTNIGIYKYSDFNVGLAGNLVASGTIWENNNLGSLTFGTALDAILLRDAANTLAQRNGTNAQTFRVYGTYTDASNFRRAELTDSTSGLVELKSSGAGTGASGNMVKLTGNTISVNGGFIAPIYTTTTNYTAAVTDRTILANGTTLTITLPTAAGATGQEYIVKLVASSTATVATTSSQNIDGATTYSLSAQYKYVKVQSDGTQWWIVANN